MLMVLILVSCSTPKKEVKVAPEEVTFEVVSFPDKPILYKGDPSIVDNKYGFEGGRIVEIGDTLHWITAEMVGDPFVVKMKIAHWKSPRAEDKWERVSTIFESSAEFTGQDPRAALWGAMPIFDEETQMWNLFYVGYRAKPSTETAWYLNYEGQVWRAVSQTPGINGIGGPYDKGEVILKPDENSGDWEGLQGTDSFFAYQVGKKWYGFYGSAKTETIPCTYWGVGMAEADDIAGPWTRMSERNPVDLKSDFAENPVIQQLEDGTFIGLVDGGHINSNFGYTVSYDGLNWAPAKFFDMTDKPNDWWHLMRTPLCILKNDDGTYTIYHTAFDDERFAGLSKAIVKRIK